MKLLLVTALLLQFSNAIDIDFAALGNLARSKMTTSNMKKASHYAQDMYDEYSGENTVVTRRKVKGRRLKFPINHRLLFSDRNCDMPFQNSQLYSCYDYGYKIPVLTGYIVSAEDLKKGYIEDRPSFYPENSIPRKYRSYPSDFKNSGFDRGHSRSHASTAWSKEDIYETYTMANIFPQTPELNRKSWLKVEKYERLIARKLGSIYVLNIAEVPENPRVIGKHKVAVPSGYYKVIVNQEADFKKCFYFMNKQNMDLSNDRLKAHEIDCNKVYY